MSNYVFTSTVFTSAIERAAGDWLPSEASERYGMTVADCEAIGAGAVKTYLGETGEYTDEREKRYEFKKGGKADTKRAEFKLTDKSAGGAAWKELSDAAKLGWELGRLDRQMEKLQDEWPGISMDLPASVTRQLEKVWNNALATRKGRAEKEAVKA